MKLIASNQITLTNVIDGKDGVGHLTTWTFYKLSNSTSAPQVVPIGASTNLSHLGPNNAWAPYSILNGGADGWNLIDFDKISKSDIIPDKPFNWYLEASFDGVSNFNGSTDFNISFENWYVNSAGSNVYNPLGIRSFTASNFSATNDNTVHNYFSQSITWTVPRAVYDAIPEGGFLNLRIRIDRFTKLFYHAKNSYVTYGAIPSSASQLGLGNYSTYGWKASPEVVTQSSPYLWIYQVQLYDNGKEVAIPPALIGAQGTDGKTPYIHFAYADDKNGTNFSLTDNNQQYQGYYSDYTEADSSDYRKYKWVDRLANVHVGGDNLITNSAFPENINNWGYFEASQANANLYVSTHEFYYNGTRKLFRLDNNTNIGVPASTKRFPVKRNTDYSLNIQTFATGNITGLTIYFLGRKSNETDKTFTKVVNVKSYTGSPSTTQTVKWHLTFNSGDCDEGFIRIDNNGTTNSDTSLLFFTELDCYDGTTDRAWQASPKDTQEQIDSKADELITQDQLNALKEQSELHQKELDSKADLDTIEKWYQEYLDYVNIDNDNREKSEAALLAISERVAGITNDLGETKERWNFIDTYMDAADEGLVIGKQDGSANIKISNDRISMFSNGDEVMWISQNMLHIANGVFVQTLQIGNFRFEPLDSNGEILGLRYLGG